MPLEIDVLLQGEVAPFGGEALAEALAADLSRFAQHTASGWAEAELSVVVCDDAVIAELNGTWRAKPVATDVLSFPQAQVEPARSPCAPMDPEGQPWRGPVGDVVISVATAALQAAEQGHSLHAEARVLLAHGLCHLMGHTHAEAAAAAQMAAAEAEVLAVWGADAARGLTARASTGSLR